MDKNIAVGGSIFRRDLNSFNYLNGNTRNTTYQESTTGFQIRAGVPLNEYLSLALRYGLNFDDVSLDRATYYTDNNGDGIAGNSANDICDVLRAGRYLCDAIGKHTTSSIGYSLIFDKRDNRVRPTRGFFATLSQDLAGLGGDVRYVRTRFEAGKYWPLGKGFIFSVRGEGGHIFSLESQRFDATGAPIEKVRLTDRFFLGEPQLRGFDIRGVGPRVRRTYFSDDGTGVFLPTSNNNQVDDALGGKLYYLAHAELEIPLGNGARELGLRPSVFMDAGAVGNLRKPSLISYAGTCVITTTNTDGTTSSIQGQTDPTSTPSNPRCLTGSIISGTGFVEQYLGDSLKPRLSIGFGVNWNSPFGPFRIDIAKVLLKEPGDDTKTITFNIGTQF
jgi:outer membrane protein insertion porin family